MILFGCETLGGRLRTLGVILLILDILVGKVGDSLPMDGTCLCTKYWTVENLLTASLYSIFSTIAWEWEIIRQHVLDTR